MREIANLSGMRFGRLVVMDFNGFDLKRKPNWNCMCDCGKRKVIAHYSLIRNLTKSCGCYFKEVVTKHGFNTKKGQDRFYRTWDAMKARTTNPNHGSAKRYSERGIGICTEWLNFINFKNDMYESYKDHLEKYGAKNTTIERVDNDLGYAIGNCKWATRKEQSNNTSYNRIIEFRNQSHNVCEWSDITGISKKALSYRINAGWDVEKALVTPVNKNLGRYKRRVNLI